jgi:biotin carboxylase
MQGPALRIAGELGFFTVAVDGSADAPCIGLADQFEQIDLKDKEGIEAFARSLQNSGRLGGIMTAGTDFSATVAWVAERLGLPGIPYEAALNASDKARMRSCFQKAGLPSPNFTTITDKNTLDGALFSCPQRTRMPEGGLLSTDTVDCSCAGTSQFYPSTPLDGALFSFPLVVKPVDNMGGRGCRRVNNMEEFREAAADALRFSRSGRAIVEAFMDGPEFSVDAIIYHGEITICGLADRHIFFPPYFIEMGHTMPTAIAPEQQAALLETFCAGVRALGLSGGKNIGAAKGDIKLTSQGPMIGEIAARLSGGYMSGWTYPYASGVQPIRAAILAAMGRKPDNLAPLKTWTSAERAFISIPGTVKAITGAGETGKQAHIQDLFLRIAEGGKVSFPRNNVSKCGNIISAAPDRTAAVEAAETAVRSILIRLDPANEETAAFLASSSHFPPDAFQLSAELRAALEKLPDGDWGTGDWGLGNREQGIENEELGVRNEELTCCLEASRTGFAEPADNDPQSPVPSPQSPISLLPFPAFTNSGLRDYVGRTVAESLQAVRELSGLSLPEISEESVKSSDNKGSYLGRSFWAAFVRGGYQGAVYYIDRLTKK